jgi:hypothetical protein
MQHRHYEIDHQVGDRLPLDSIKAIEIGIAPDDVDHMGGGEMVDVIGQRRQRMGGDRDRDRGGHRDEESGDGQAGQSAGRGPEAIAMRCRSLHVRAGRFAVDLIGCTSTHPARPDGTGDPGEIICPYRIAA